MAAKGDGLDASAAGSDLGSDPFQPVGLFGREAKEKLVIAVTEWSQ